MWSTRCKPHSTRVAPGPNKVMILVAVPRIRPVVLFSPLIEIQAIRHFRCVHYIQKIYGNIRRVLTATSFYHGQKYQVKVPEQRFQIICKQTSNYNASCGVKQSVEMKVAQAFSNTFAQLLKTYCNFSSDVGRHWVVQCSVICRAVRLFTRLQITTASLCSFLLSFPFLSDKKTG